MKETFGLFSERLLELCNRAFSPMYRRVFHQYWNNTVFSRVKHNYVHTDWENGIFEAYLPTNQHPDHNMSYYRIMVKVLPALDKDIIKDVLPDLTRPRITPAGRIDSETIVFVAPRRTDKGIRERQYLRAFNHTPPTWLNCKTPGFKTVIILNKVPEIAMKRLLMIVANFLKRRLQALLKSLKLEPWMIDYIREERLYYMDILEHFSLSVRNFVKSMSHAFRWVLTKMVEVMCEIGRQSIVFTVIHALPDLRSDLTRIRDASNAFRREPEPPLIKQLIQILVPRRKVEGVERGG